MNEPEAEAKEREALLLPGRESMPAFSGAATPPSAYVALARGKSDDDVDEGEEYEHGSMTAEADCEAGKP